MADKEMYGPAILMVSQGISLFQNLLPKLGEIRRADPAMDVELAADVRLGEVAAITLLVGMATVASTFTNSLLPVAIAVIVSAILVILYESALNGNAFSPRSISYEH